MRPQYFLYIFLILLTIYSDSPLQLVLDTFGESFVPVVSIVLCSIAFPLGLLNRTDKFIKEFKKLIIYTLAISILALILYFLDGKLTVRGEFLPLKMVKVMLYFVGYVCFLSLLYNLTYSMSIDKILIPFLFAFFILTMVLFVEMTQLPDAFSMLHFRSPPPYWRPRLLCPESSYTASQIQVFGVISLYYCAFVKKSKFLSSLVFICIVTHIACTDSKTLLLSLLIFFGIYAFNKLKKSTIIVKVLTIILGVGVASLLSIFIVSRLVESFTQDLEETTSTVTRTYTMLCAYGIGTVYPFGTGFQTYMDLLPYTMKHYTWVLDYVFDTSNLREIQDLIGGDDGKNLSAKSFLAQSTIYWGIFGTIYFIHILYKRFRQTEKMVTKSGFWLIKGLFYILLIELLFSSNLSYDILAFIVVVLILPKKYQAVIGTVNSYGQPLKRKK